MALTLPPLGTIDGVPSNDTASPYYLPPPGYYQNDAGQVVPKSQTNTPAATSSTPWYQSILNGANSGIQAVTMGLAPNLPGATGTHTFEDFIFVILGLILIIAGIFGFDKTKTVIVGAGKAAAKAGELAG